MVLISLLIFIIYSFRQEQTKRNRMYKEMQELSQTRRATNDAYAALLESSIYGEAVSIWDKEDFAIYQNKRKETCLTLQRIKPLARTSNEQSKIDSLCLLLERKENLLDTLMNTFSHIQTIGEIVEQKIPTIVSSIEKDKAHSNTISEVREEPSKNNFFSRIFKRKEKKSAYLKQKEKVESVTGQKQDNSTMRMLHSLNKEVMEYQENEREKLYQQMLDLYRNNKALNSRLKNFVKELETNMDDQYETRYRQLMMERDHSFYRLSCLSVFISLLMILLYAIIHRDVRRNHKYQREIESSNLRNKELLQSRKNMMLSIAHDLRSPLSTIKGAAELLPEESVPEHRKEYLESISHASDYMLTLVETLMNFYLLDTEQNRPQISVYNLESLFKEVSDNFLLQARKKELRFSRNFLNMDIVVSGDRGQLQQVISNLIANALKFTEKGGICLSAEYHGGELRFSVQDTGCGMDNKDRERIFTAFERLENARNIPGFGLGLTIAYRLVSQMGGNIRVESRPGEGSTFIVILPLRQADEKSPIEESKPVSVISRLNGISVLLLDDDIRQLRITGEMLKRLGADCALCTNSRELISRMREKNYDVLLTDIQMPEMDGFSILELLRSSNIGCANTIPVIALTARVDDDMNYLSCGFAGCIRKPFSIDSLSASISEIVGTVKEQVWEPDLSLLFTGEENHEEMLRIFVDESRKELFRLRDAMYCNDRQSLHNILHKNLPLWETVNLDYPIEMLHELVSTNPEEWQEKHLKEIYRIEQAAAKLIIHIEKMQEETHEKDNTDN